MHPRLGAVLGALTADAASLGLHWLYDRERLASIAAREPVAFLKPEARNYEGARGYFAHAAKKVGDLSGYGESAALMLLHLVRHGGRLERIEFQKAYRDHFGPGGAYVGYVDRPTRLTLATLLAIERPEDFPARSGADDDQLPALSCIPPIVAAMSARDAGDVHELLAVVEEAVAVTNDHPVALDGARTAARALAALLAGRPLAAALASAAQEAESPLKPLLAESLAMPALDAAMAAQKFGMPCHVEQGLPLLFHIAHRARNFREAVEQNILAGGDSCGRSIMLGALTGAAYAREHGIPASWLARVRRMAEFAQAAERLLGE